MKKAIISILFIICVCSVFSKNSFSPALQGYMQGSSVISTVKDNNKSPVHFTGSFGFDAMAVNFGINRFEAGIGYSFLYNSRSNITGNTFLREYMGMGIAVGTKYHFDCGFSLGAKFRYLFCSFIPFNNRFDTIEHEVTPEMDIVKNRNFETTLVFPLTFSYKNDSVSIRAGFGVCIKYNLVFGGNNEA